LLAEVAKIAELRERIEELERQVGRDSGNSSMPPSSDPPMSRQERRAEARRRAKESLRRQGGQPGHEGKSREMAPPERIDERFDHLPVSCECGHAFDGSEEHLGSPLAHQVWELPPIAPTVAEHRRHRLLCPGCGAARLAELPTGVSASAFGPRLVAVMLGMAPPFGRAPKSRLRSGPSIYPSTRSALGESVAHRRLRLRCQAPGRLRAAGAVMSCGRRPYLCSRPKASPKSA
jgi:transposase